MPNSRMAGGMSAPVGGVSRETLLSFAVPDLQIERNRSCENHFSGNRFERSCSVQSVNPEPRDRKSVV